MAQQLPLQPRPLQIVTHVRKLRGGSQAHLIQADDGCYYAIKAKNNPQHRRVLINEWFAAALWQAAQLPVPEVSMVEITPECLLHLPELRLQIGTRHEPLATGSCFASKWLARDPTSQPVFDTLPARSLDTQLFVGALVADQWLCQADTRQAAFVLRKNQQATLCFIDHGFIWNGRHWQFPSNFLASPYPVASVYETMTDSSIGQWIDTFQSLPLKRLCAHALAHMPSDWLELDEAEFLEYIFIQLKQRLRELPDDMERVSRRIHESTRGRF